MQKIITFSLTVLFLLITPLSLASQVNAATNYNVTTKCYYKLKTNNSTYLSGQSSVSAPIKTWKQIGKCRNTTTKEAFVKKTVCTTSGKSLKVNVSGKGTYDVKSNCINITNYSHATTASSAMVY